MIDNKSENDITPGVWREIEKTFNVEPDMECKVIRNPRRISLRINRLVSAELRIEFGEEHWSPPTVNWSAIGSQPTEDARRFAAWIQYAIKFIEREYKKIPKQLRIPPLPKESD